MTAENSILDLKESLCYDRKTTRSRWFALILASLFGFGAYFCYDNPQALQKPIQEKFHVDTTNFNLLYTTYSTPNIFLPLIGGFLVDKLGVRMTGFIFAIFPILGQAIIVYGAYEGTFNLLLIGRVISGLGGDTLLVCQAAILTKWFSEKELSIAMGTALNISSIGSSINSFLSPYFYEKTGEIQIPLIVGFFLCVLSMMAVVLLNIMDRIADKKENVDNQSEAKTEEEFQFKDLKKLEKIFYLLMFAMIIMDGAFMTFMANANDYLVERFGYSSSLAGLFIAGIYILGLVVAPIFGVIAGKIGRRVSFFILSIFLMFGSQIYLSMLPDTESSNSTFLPLIGLEGSSSTTQSSQQSVGQASLLSLMSNSSGSAYGFVMSLANVMISIIPILSGTIRDATLQEGHGYFWTGVLLAGLCVVALVVALALLKEDRKTGERLEKNVEEKEVLESGSSCLIDDMSDIEIETEEIPSVKLQLDFSKIKTSGLCITPPLLRSGRSLGSGRSTPQGGLSPKLKKQKKKSKKRRKSVNMSVSFMEDMANYSYER
eukprot:CAMPEP_0114595542 /NCGR_PEP_ID=MMETSP0125-20121206/17354_1 /TAXON_ID=485358 ORGANISM="Aristerostoma sp., Strain ATCC 50986" /NCGR_SAMPLE_ID=MMETSP0125 /ASSEMBLY_ACC=CAM_ASM_000245 /LENGTH=544 /DNA_ID=CAMNT_0001797261 /DNA_START=19 /DNA_END=1653 /DNA_ORIENTATION=+